MLLPLSEGIGTIGQQHSSNAVFKQVCQSTKHAIVLPLTCRKNQPQPVSINA